MIEKITNTDTENLTVSSLPTRPTASAAFGGKGYSSVQMKEAFDKLPLFICEKFNELIDAIAALGESSLSAMIPTGVSDGHTLKDLFSDITSGALATYLTVDGESLANVLREIRNSNTEFRPV